MADQKSVVKDQRFQKVHNDPVRLLLHAPSVGG